MQVEPGGFAQLLTVSAEEGSGANMPLETASAWRGDAPADVTRPATAFLAAYPAAIAAKADAAHDAQGNESELVNTLAAGVRAICKQLALPRQARTTAAALAAFAAALLHAAGTFPDHLHTAVTQAAADAIQVARRQQGVDAPCIISALIWGLQQSCPDAQQAAQSLKAVVSSLPLLSLSADGMVQQTLELWVARGGIQPALLQGVPALLRLPAAAYHSVVACFATGSTHATLLADHGSMPIQCNGADLQKRLKPPVQPRLQSSTVTLAVANSSAAGASARLCFLLRDNETQDDSSAAAPVQKALHRVLQGLQQTVEDMCASL